MGTLKQNIKHKHKKLRKYHKTRTPSLKKCPHKKGLCIKIFKESPKKPNSAKRSVVKIRLSTGRRVRAQVPGEGHKIMKFNRLLIRGGKTRDLPGVKYRVLRGKYDCTPVLERRQGFSKYGIKSSVIVGYEEKKYKEFLKNLSNKENVIET